MKPEKAVKQCIYAWRMDEKCKYFTMVKRDVLSPLKENVRFLRECSFVPINIESTPKSKLACFLSYLTPQMGLFQLLLRLFFNSMLISENALLFGDISAFQTR